MSLISIINQQFWNSWNCKVVLALFWNFKLSRSLSHLIQMSWYWPLLSMPTAQWPFNVLLAALLICLLHVWIQFYVLFFLLVSYSCETHCLGNCNGSFCMFVTDRWYIKLSDFGCFETLRCPEISLIPAGPLLSNRHWYLILMLLGADWDVYKQLRWIAEHR